MPLLRGAVDRWGRGLASTVHVLVAQVASAAAAAAGRTLQTNP